MVMHGDKSVSVVPLVWHGVHMLCNWWLPSLCFVGVRARGTEHEEPVHMEGQIAQQGRLQTFWVRPPHTMPRQLSGMRFQVHLNWNSAQGLLGCLAGKGTVGWKGDGRLPPLASGVEGSTEGMCLGAVTGTA